LIKNVIFAVLKFALFLLVFAAGSFMPPFHLEHVVGTTPDGTRVFIWDGFLLMTVAFVILLGIEAARKRINTASPWTVIAYILAAVAGYAAKLGFLTRP
jgi:hypothetical protein